MFNFMDEESSGRARTFQTGPAIKLGVSLLLLLGIWQLYQQIYDSGFLQYQATIENRFRQSQERRISALILKVEEYSHSERNETLATDIKTSADAIIADEMISSTDGKDYWNAWRMHFHQTIDANLTTLAIERLKEFRSRYSQ